MFRSRVGSLRRRVVTGVLLGAVGVAGMALQPLEALASAPAPIPLTSSSCPSLIRSGEVDGCVTELQTLLNQHGAGLTVDGNFGAGTLQAVKSFQSSVGIGVDGIVGSLTKSKLTDTGGSVPSPLDLRTSACPTYIQQGQSGGCVTQLQDLLNQRSNAHITVDGSFGPATLAAVKAFQSASGLTADGIVGSATKNALYGSGSVPQSAVNLLSTACPTNMVQGEIDGCVTTLQSLLNRYGQSLTVDGNFGSGTLAAVKAFQSNYGLTPDGIVGPATKGALYGNVNGNGGSGTPAPVNLQSPACPTDIQQGQHSGCVTELQSLLNHHGSALAVDGNFGPLTAAAVQGFQSSYGLSADGIVGPNTKAALYGQIPQPPPPPSGSGAIQQTVVNEAFKVVNGSPIPYVWGGGHSSTPGPSIGTCFGYTGSIQPCPADHTVGVDCSGFSRWMYFKAGVVLGPGNTDSQMAQGTTVSQAAAVPGDLIFFLNSSGGSHHVGIYIGNGNMLNALQTGTNVRRDPINAAGGTQVFKHYGPPTNPTPPPGPPTGGGTLTLHTGFSTSTDLTRPSGLTVNFIQRFVSNYHSNSPFIADAQIFLDAEHTYGVNAQYLLAHAIQESAWGLSPIKAHNYFGFGAYDSCPSTCSAGFSSDQEGIMYVASYIRQNYLTPGGKYFVAPTLDGMHVHYATDPAWASNIASIAGMEDRFS